MVAIVQSCDCNFTLFAHFNSFLWIDQASSQCFLVEMTTKMILWLLQEGMITISIHIEKY